MSYWKYFTAKVVKTLFYSSVAYAGPTLTLATLGPIPFVIINAFIYAGGVEFILMMAS